MSRYFRFGLGLLVVYFVSQVAMAVDIPKTPKSKGKTIKIKSTVFIGEAGKTLDYKGAKLVWTGPGDCSQKEGQDPMFRVAAANVTIKNAVIVDAPDGIHIHRANAVIENVVFPDVCEDAITMHRGASKATVKGCFFRDSADKSIQVNSGRGHKVIGNTFVDVGQAIRVKPGSRVEFKDNLLYQTRVGVHADGKDARVKVGGNRFYKVKEKYVAEKKAKISNKDEDDDM